MGGRGSSNGVKTVSYSKWGKRKQNEQIYGVDENGERMTVGYVDDEYEYDSVEDIRPVTLAQLKREINDWLNDKDENGWWSYGTADTRIVVAYDNGDVIADDELGGKKFKKSGIIGVAISTGDYEEVAGDEWVGTGTRKQRIPMRTWSPDGETGLTNSYSGYKSTKVRLVRREERYVPVYDSQGNVVRYRTVRKVIRRSTWRNL